MWRNNQGSTGFCSLEWHHARLLSRVFIISLLNTLPLKLTLLVSILPVSSDPFTRFTSWSWHWIAFSCFSFVHSAEHFGQGFRYKSQVTPQQYSTDSPKWADVWADWRFWRSLTWANSEASVKLRPSQSPKRSCRAKIPLPKGISSIDSTQDSKLDTHSSVLDFEYAPLRWRASPNLCTSLFFLTLLAPSRLAHFLARQFRNQLSRNDWFATRCTQSLEFQSFSYREHTILPYHFQ